MVFQLKSFKRELRVTLLANIHYFELTANYGTVSDKHDFCEMIYVDSGALEISSENYSGPLEKRQMILHLANEEHSFACPSTLAPNVIVIGFRCESAALARLSYAPLTLDERMQKLLSEIVREGRNVFMPPYDIPNLKNMPKRKNFEFGSDQLIQNLLECFLLYALREIDVIKSEKSNPSEQVGDRIRSIKEYVDNNFTKGVTVADLCYLFGTNKTTLSREFKRMTDCTLIEYVNRLRIAHTKKLLREGRYTLTQIADILNLSSVHYLTALFKKYEKLTPTEYLSSVKAKYE